MYIYVHAAFLLNFILKNISPKKLIKDGNWYKLFGVFIELRNRGQCHAEAVEALFKTFCRIMFRQAQHDIENSVSST